MSLRQPLAAQFLGDAEMVPRRVSGRAVGVCGAERREREFLVFGTVELGFGVEGWEEERVVEGD